MQIGQLVANLTDQLVMRSLTWLSLFCVDYTHWRHPGCQWWAAENIRRNLARNYDFEVYNFITVLTFNSSIAVELYVNAIG